MSIKESALSVISSIAQGDFVRAVTSDGNSRRVTVANLAKAVVESYTGSSLGGSQRSVKAAIDSLNSKIEYETIEFAVSGGWSAGKTLGSRCAQIIRSTGLSSNKYVIGVAIMYIGDSSLFIPVPFVYGTELYCNYYAASAAACSEQQSTVRIRLSYINA